MVTMDLDSMRCLTEVGFDFAIPYEWRGTTPKLIGYTCQNIVRSVFRRAMNHNRTTIAPGTRISSDVRSSDGLSLLLQGVGEMGRWQRRYLFSFPAFSIHRQVAGECLNTVEGRTSSEWMPVKLMPRRTWLWGRAAVAGLVPYMDREHEV